MRSEQDEANLRLVERVYVEVLDALDPAAVDALFDPGYIQHNPNVETGTAGLKAMLVRAKGKYPNVVEEQKSPSKPLTETVLTAPSEI